MHYDYNRKAFASVRGAAGVEPLVIIYCSLVLLELSLKQHLKVVEQGANKGHDLPDLLIRLAYFYPIGHPIRQRHFGQCTSLSTSLARVLQKIWAQYKNGQPKLVPPNQFPNIRYLRHTSDWNSSANGDADVNKVKSQVDLVLDFVSRHMKVKI